MAVYQLDDELWFPDPKLGESIGLFAVGGDLSVDRLLLAYSNGIFPWFSFKDSKEPWWYCPLERFVIFPHKIHISHSMKQLLRQKRYTITINLDFDSVIEGCSKANNRLEKKGAWLGPNMIAAYKELHRQGYASSIEVWESHPDTGLKLVGGLYGVTIHNAFFGESMFSLVPNASKLALIHLAQFMEKKGWHFIDCQYETPLFRSMGGEYISYDDYIQIIQRPYQEPCP